MIYLFTAPIRTGKTTQLMAWAKDRQDVGGFFSPDAGGHRVICRPQSIENHEPFEVKIPDGIDVQTIGKFHFLESAFAKAKKWTIEDLENPEIKWIIIDELGKLELKERGFHELMKTIKANSHKNYLIIVRKSLLEEITSFYRLTHALIITPERLSEIY